MAKYDNSELIVAMEGRWWASTYVCVRQTRLLSDLMKEELLDLMVFLMVIGINFEQLHWSLYRLPFSLIQTVLWMIPFQFQICMLCVILFICLSIEFES